MSISEMARFVLHHIDNPIIIRNTRSPTIFLCACASIKSVVMILISYYRHKCYLRVCSRACVNAAAAYNANL